MTPPRARRVARLIWLAVKIFVILTLIASGSKAVVLYQNF